MKEKLLEAKARLIDLVLEDVKKGRHSYDLYQIIREEIQLLELEDTQEERKQKNKEYNKMLTKILSDF